MRVWLRIQKNVVLFKWVNFGENIWAFCWDKRNCLLYTGVHIKWVTIEWGSTVYNILCQYDKSTLVSSLLWVAVIEICYSDSPRWLNTVTGDEKGLTSQLISTPPLLAGVLHLLLFMKIRAVEELWGWAYSLCFYLRRLECLIICRCHNKGSTFSSDPECWSSLGLNAYPIELTRWQFELQHILKHLHWYITSTSL